MSSISHSLNSRGWAFLILAGGLVFSVPFFKAGNSESRYSSSSSAVASGNRPNTSASSPLASPSTPIPSTNRMVDSLPQVNLPLPRTTIDANGIVELKPNSSPSVASNSTVEQPAVARATISQPANTEPETSIGALPIRTELPAWAKKSSLIDSLVTTASNGTSSKEAGDLQGLPTARKPTPYQAWTPEQRSQALASASGDPTDRHSPFSGNVDSTKEQDHVPSNKKVHWPDEDPRTAVSQPPKQRLVGRDAIIRDPELLKTLSDPIGRTVVHPSRGQVDVPSLNPSNAIVQPKFGQANTPASRGPQIGPALRSKLPPDEQHFIRQPLQ